MSGPCLGEPGLGRIPGGFRGFQRRAGVGKCATGGLFGGGGGGEARWIDRLGADAGKLLRHLGVLGGEAASALRRGLTLLGGGLGAGGLLGGGLGGAVGLGLGGPGSFGGFGGGGLGGGHAVRMGARGLGQGGGLGGQAGGGGGGVAAHLLGMGEVAGDLRQPAFGFAQGGAGAGLFRRVLLLGEAEAFQHGSRGGLGLAQRGQGGGGFRRAGGAVARGPRGGLRGGAGGGERGGGGGARGFGDGALDRQQLRLGGADRTREVAVAAGLPRLALQPGELGFELAAQILGSRQVGLGGLQLQLGFVAAGVQTGDAGRFLQHRAAVLGPGGDQRADPPLAYHRRGARAGRQIGEQGLHVARAQFLAVHPVDAAAAAFELAGDFEVGLLMKGRRREAGGLFKGQYYLGEVARRSAGGAGEDHVVHLAPAQGAGIRFAHRPAQRLDDVRLAAAVRPDDAGQAGADLHRGGFGKTLEPGDAQTGEADRQA